MVRDPTSQIMAKFHEQRAITPEGILRYRNFAIICDVGSLTQVISNQTLRNLDTILKTKMSCSCSKMIYIIPWLQKLFKK